MRYIGAESYVLNDSLRQGIDLTDEQKEWVAILDKALEKIPKYEGIVTRSLDFRRTYNKELENFLTAHSIDKIVEYPAYTSTTTGVIYNPEGEVQLMINSKTGRNITAMNKGEKEILFERNKKFKVKEVIKRKGKYVIKMEEENE